MIFQGELSAEQRARLLEIAERCPVHRTLSTETRIRTTAVTPP
jgi:putative redox protein